MRSKLVIFFMTFFGSLCFGLIFVVIFVHSTQLNCLRQTAGVYTCQIRTLFLGKIPVFQHDVQNVTGIAIAEDDSADGTSYRAEFSTANGPSVPLSEIWTDYGPVSQQVSAIGSQMDRGAAQVSYVDNSPGWVLILIGGLTILGILLSPLSFLKGSTN